MNIRYREKVNCNDHDIHGHSLNLGPWQLQCTVLTCFSMDKNLSNFVINTTWQPHATCHLTAACPRAHVLYSIQHLVLCYSYLSLNMVLGNTSIINIADLRSQRPLLCRFNWNTYLYELKIAFIMISLTDDLG